MYLLDSDTLIFLLRNHQAVVARFQREKKQDLRTSIICISELHYGAYKSGDVQKHLSPVQQLARYLSVLPLDIAGADQFGRLKAQLERQGQRLNDADLWIAATALSHNFTLVTHNQKHFARVQGLKLEDWVG